PPRPEAIQAVKDAERAGVRTVMITGDHPKTARAIGEAMGMRIGSDEIITGPELDALTETDLVQRVPSIRVYARVSPPHKLRVVRAWKSRGEIVAMTGDGVNDAPALKEADIGVAMGKTGTDVTKEAAAMILTDDNFATIVRAIEEGRAIYDNIRKFIRYLLSCNVGEVLVMFLAAFLGLPLPLLPIQILFVNLVTDGLPAMALGVDPPGPGVMDRPPRPPKENIFARGLGQKIAFRGILIGVSTLLVFVWCLQVWGMGLREARTMALTTLILSQLFHVFDARAEDRSFLEIGLFSNMWAVGAVLSSIFMLLAIIYLPYLRELFKTDPLGGLDWVLVVLASGFIQLLAALRDAVLRPLRHIGRGLAR
ncbi:MAG TPA: ATPase, partial [Sulfobacillus sp.]|nr:ATPase [Sulfobacillus sp.]